MSTSASLLSATWAPANKPVTDPNKLFTLPSNTTDSNIYLPGITLSSSILAFTHSVGERLALLRSDVGVITSLGQQLCVPN